MFGKFGLRQFVYNRLKLWAAMIALERPFPDRIPLDPHRAQSRDYTTAYFSTPEDRHAFLVQRVGPQSVGVLAVASDGGQRLESTISVSDLSEFGAFFVRYYRELEIRYTSALKYIIHEYTGARWWLWRRERSAQQRFNRRTLTRLDRIRVLEMFLDADLETGVWGVQLGAGGLVDRVERHAGRFWRHPDAERHLRYYELVLQSLSDTRDLIIVNGTEQYRLAPKALATLSRYAAEDRRHRDMRRLQAWVVGLTIIIALATAAQAIPGLWNFVTEACSSAHNVLLPTDFEHATIHFPAKDQHADAIGWIA